MNKEIVFSILIITIITLIALKSQEFTHHTVEVSTIGLEETKNNVKKQINIDSIKEKMNDIYREWESNENILALYLEHNELRDIDELMEEILGELEEKPEDALSQINKCITNLKYVEEKQLFNLKNLF